MGLISWENQAEKRVDGSLGVGSLRNKRIGKGTPRLERGAEGESAGGKVKIHVGETGNVAHSWMKKG